MASIKRIATEDADAEQWRLLSRYAYPANIRTYLEQRGLTPDPSLLELVAGCFRQSEAYLGAARLAPFDIAPLLAYYGTTNLLAGAGAMLTGAPLPIKNHGMTLVVPATGFGRLADLEVRPVSPKTGGLRATPTSLRTRAR